MNGWGIEVYFVTDYGSGWDTTDAVFDSKQDAERKARRLLRYDQVESVRVYEVGEDE